MKRIIIGIIICIILTILTSLFIPKIIVNSDIVNAIYTICGIMFSIGMSLIITMNLSEIKNKRFKIAIRTRLKEIRNNLLMCFAIASASYILLSLISGKIIRLSNHFYFNFSLLETLILCYSIVYSILIFISIEDLSHQIQDAIDEELKFNYTKK